MAWDKLIDFICSEEYFPLASKVCRLSFSSEKKVASDRCIGPTIRLEFCQRYSTNFWQTFRSISSCRLLHREKSKLIRMQQLEPGICLEITHCDIGANQKFPIFYVLWIFLCIFIVFFFWGTFPSGLSLLTGWCSSEKENLPTSFKKSRLKFVIQWWFPSLGLEHD